MGNERISLYIQTRTNWERIIHFGMVCKEVPLCGFEHKKKKLLKAGKSYIGHFNIRQNQAIPLWIILIGVLITNVPNLTYDQVTI